MKVRQSTVRDCLRAMQYNLEMPVYHGGSARALGTAYHAALEWYYDSRARWGDYSPIMEDLIEHAIDVFDKTVAMEPSHESELSKQPGRFIWNKTVPDRDDAIAKLKVMIPTYFAPDGGVWPSDWEIVAVEHGFQLPWKGPHTRNGSIDLVLRAPDGGIVCDDHKTAGRRWNQGAEKPRKKHQSAWYVSAAREIWPDAPYYRFCFSVMTYTGQFERRISDPQPKHEQAADDLLFQTVALYETMRANGMDLPANPSSNLCSEAWCDHWDICPHGAALDH